ncbi:hypothetical protein ACVWZ6_004637 [Bradyrhizobium sp. GM6.1]|jgi:hypothetical protein
MLTFKRLLQDIAFNKMSIGIAHAHRFPLLHEKHALRELLVYLDVDCVFDVGANEGQYAELLRSIGYDGQIVRLNLSRDSQRRCAQKLSTTRVGMLRALHWIQRDGMSNLMWYRPIHYRLCIRRCRVACLSGI